MLNYRYVLLFLYVLNALCKMLPLSLCFSAVDFLQVVESSQKEQKLLIVYYSYNFEKDSLLALYIDWLANLYNSLYYDAKIAILSSPKDLMHDFVQQTIGLIPREAILVVISQYEGFPNVNHVAHLKLRSDIELNSSGKFRFSVFHLNHERPWYYGPNQPYSEYFSSQMLEIMYGVLSKGIILDSILFYDYLRICWK